MLPCFQILLKKYSFFKYCIKKISDIPMKVHRTPGEKKLIIKKNSSNSVAII